MRGLLLRFFKNYYSKVQKDITSGGEVCHLHYFSDAKLTSETCKAENAPYFNLYTHEETGIEYVENYQIKNIDEFKACLIVLAQNP